MALYRIHEHDHFTAPVVVVAFDGWVDAGGASTTAAERLAGAGHLVASFDADRLYDYRARRPTLRIQDGRPTSLTWPELHLRRAPDVAGEVLVLTGPEPDYRWRELATAAVELAEVLGIEQWISLGAIPAVVPHTRPVPILGTESRPGLLRGDVQPGPAGSLTVPSAATSVLDLAVTEAGIAAVGYYAQIPHYISGEYPVAAVALLRAVETHLGVDLPAAELAREAEQLLSRLDTATELDDTTKTYVARLEGMVDESRLPSGEDLIADIERFLRDRDPGSGGSGRPN